MKTIIVPMDFSNESLSGLNMALMLAKKTGAAIQMVHIIGKNENKDAESIEKDKKKAILKFENLLKKYKTINGTDFTLTYTVGNGKIFEEVSTIAQAQEETLIVLSTHGESGFEDLFIGGNAYKIVSHSKNPLITVRRSEKPTEFKKIVLPLDITFQTREKVPYTLEIAKLFDSEIHLVTVRQTTDKSIENKLHQYAGQVANYFEQQKVPIKIDHLLGDNITDITIDYANAVNADLISMMTEQEKSVTNILLGTYAHQMINKSHVPVLSFPNYPLSIVSDDIWTLGAFNERTQI